MKIFSIFVCLGNADGSLKMLPLFVIMGYIAGGIFLLFFLFFLGRFLRPVFIFLGKILFAPWTFIRWLSRRRDQERERLCRELCAEYFFIIGNNPQTIRYFEELIEQGIKPKELQRILEANLLHYKQLEEEKELQKLEAFYRSQVELAQFKEEKEELLAQTRINLEQLRNKEKLLSQIYDKLKEKYQSELPIPQESQDE